MKQIFVALVAIALAVTPVSAETLGNVGNGVDSTNNATVNETNTTTVSQTNAASISNNLSVSSNTGGNTADRNTGGSVNVSTGDSGVKATVQNFANQNVANVQDCCNLGGNTSVTNSGNGDSSANNAVLNSTNSTALTQYNVADISNSVAVSSNTGNNSADRNTGSGLNAGVSVSSGDSLVGPITISNNANANYAQVGSGLGAGAGAGAGITLGNGGNGVDTTNNAVANLYNSTAVSQYNDADVLNWVGITSNTGYNTADRNTGGVVNVDSGDSAIAVALGTNVNSNAAWVANCGCVQLGDSVVKNLGNGDSAYSNAVLNKYNASAATQANLSEVANVGYFDSNTGYNTADSNTGAVLGWSDPSVSTGVAYTNVGATTAANQNMLNSGNVAMPSPSPVGSGNGSWWFTMGYGYNMMAAH